MILNNLFARKSLCPRLCGNNTDVTCGRASNYNAAASEHISRDHISQDDIEGACDEAFWR